MTSLHQGYFYRANLLRHMGLKTSFYALIFCVSIFTFLNAVIERFDVRSLVLQMYDVNVVVYDESKNAGGAAIVDSKSNRDDGCVFPVLNPWDPTILDFIEHPSPVKCTKVQPELTFISDDGLLQFNESEYEYYVHVKNYSNLECTYRTFDRGLGHNDNEWIYGGVKTLEAFHSVVLAYDMVEVTCNGREPGSKKSKEIYFNIHAHPAGRPPRTFAQPTEDQLSVLMVVIDSVATSVLQRNMPLTYDYVTNEMKMVMFKRLNKLGDNTRPNMFAALAGKRYFDEQADMKAEIIDEPDLDYYDSIPLIWKFFSAKGYATVFNEDKPEWGLFHYMKHGFTKKPTDFYYHIFWNALKKAGKRRDYDRLCFANAPKVDLSLDINRRHIMSMQNSLQFIYNFLTEYSHDYGNEIEKTDRSYANFFREMYENGYLNKTVVIFMSDHGHRFSQIRSTLIGLLEERNPFYGLWFPDWFYRLHPNVEQNLRVNSQKRLTSMFDVHETLKDILDANYDGSQRKLDKRGLSHLYEIPLNRTCQQAGVPDHYCLCVEETPLNISLAFIQDAAVSAVKHLNRLLDHRAPGKCQKIVYNRTLRAESLTVNEKVREGFISDGKGGIKKQNFNIEKLAKKNSAQKIRIAFSTQPNGALFEAVVLTEVSKNDKTWIVDGDVQRLNSYSNTSYCVDDAILRKFCFCIHAP